MWVPIHCIARTYEGYVTEVASLQSTWFVLGHGVPLEWARSALWYVNIKIGVGNRLKLTWILVWILDQKKINWRKQSRDSW